MNTQRPNGFEKEISDFCEAVNSEIEDSLGVVLYGSHANDTATKGSDTDVLVILRRRTRESIEKLRGIAKGSIRPL